MKKRLALILSSICIMSLGMGSIASAQDTTLDFNEQVNSIVANSEIEGYEFKELDINTINTMKEQMKSEQQSEKLKQYTSKYSVASSSTLSSHMALESYQEGFYHTSELLNYSMLSMREEPKIYVSGTTMVSDIWNYSPDFKNAIVAFLSKARSAGSYEYFAQTTIQFTPSSIAETLTNQSALKRTDLYTSLHSVSINLAVVKEGIRWNILAQIHDTYDFAQADYDTLVNIANNIAYYDQEMGNIRPFPIVIYADKVSQSTLPYSFPTW